MKNIMLFLMFLCGSLTLQAQDISKIDWKKPIKISGSLGGSSMFYASSGIGNRRDPFYWTLNANLNISILGTVDVPLSANISQQNNEYSAQPFNQFGLSPSYKFVKAHVGYRSMDFSQFTLSGMIFLGAGLEIQPENSPVKVSMMYGRFAQAVTQGGQVGILSGEPTYERWGYGAKVTLGRQPSREVNLILFRAKDDPTSIPDQPNDSGIKPSENLVLGLVTRQQVYRFVIDLDYAFSAYTHDTRLMDGEMEDYRWLRLFGKMHTANGSSQYNYAINTGIAYAKEAYQIRLGYKRITPEFRSMGTAFLNNDLEEISANVSWRMLADKMTVSVGGGFQRNNLSQTLATDMTRLTYQSNVNYNPSEKLAFTFSFSNFSSSNKTLVSARNVTDQSLRLDSLRMVQVTNSASFTASYSMGSDSSGMHSFSFNGGYQGANDQNNNANTFFNAGLSYQYSFSPLDMSFSASLDYNQNSVPNSNNMTIGPTFGANKTFLEKKLRCSYSATLASAYTNSVYASFNTNHRLSAAYSIGKHHSLSANANYLLRHTAEVSAKQSPTFNEVRTGLSYNYNF